MGAPAAILAAFIALAGAAWSLDLPDILSFNLINLLGMLIIYISIYIDLRWRVYERTKEWIKISGRFKSIKYFFLLCSVYAALAVIPGPSDFFVVKMKVILILGGSAALYFVGLASTRFEKEFCVNSVVLSSISAATLLNIAGPTEVFLSILIYLLALIFFPVEFLFFFAIFVRIFLFADYGPALFFQTSFVYCLKKWRKKSPLWGALFIAFFFCCSIWLGTGMLKGILFPLSGALAIYFFFVATCGKEHTIAALFYITNLLFMCYVTSNKEAAIYILYIYAGVLLIFTLLCILKRFNDRDNDRKVSKFTDDFSLILLEGKVIFFFVFFGPIFPLLPVSVAEQWVHALAETLFLQVAFLQIYLFILKSLTKEKDRSGGLPPPGHRRLIDKIK